MVSDLNTSLGKMSDFVSSPLFELTLVIKLRNIHFQRHAIVWVDFSHKTEKF